MALAITDTNTVLHFIDYFRNKGINDNGLCGLLGNIYAESGVRCNNLQNSYEKKWNVTDESYTYNVDRGTWIDPINNQPFEFDKGGYGLCQWTSPGRKKGLLDKAHELNQSIASEEVQFEWLWTELNGSYRKVLAELVSSTNTIESCAEIVVCKFEIPKSVLGDEETKKKTVDKRSEYARAFYEEFIKPNEKGASVMNEIVVAINAGHWLGNPKGVPKNMPILGGTLEWTLNSRVVDEFVRIASNYNGIKVLQNYDVTGKTKKGNELEDRIRMAEKAKAKIYFSIHHNGGGGSGTTVYYYQGNKTNLRQATAMYNEIKARTGLKGNRATPISGNRTLTEIVVPTMNSYLIECAFMDNATDLSYIAKPEWPTQIAEGLMAFLCKEFGFTKKVNLDTPKEEAPKEVKEEPTPTPTPTVTVGNKVKVSYKTRIYSKTDSFADPGVYTITETENGMGKLKSGMGWINLTDTKKV